MADSRIPSPFLSTIELPTESHGIDSGTIFSNRVVRSLQILRQAERAAAR